MGSDTYPPGHPSGTTDCDVEVVCEACGHSYWWPGRLELDTNYAEANPGAYCPKCGHEDGEDVPRDVLGDCEDVRGDDCGDSVAGACEVLDDYCDGVW